MKIYERHRFPPDITSYAVWVYYCFNLSHRNVEDLLAQRGITGVAHRELVPETINSTKQYENNRAEQSHEATRVRELLDRRCRVSLV